VVQKDSSECLDKEKNSGSHFEPRKHSASEVAQNTAPGPAADVSSRDRTVSSSTNSVGKASSPQRGRHEKRGSASSKSSVASPRARSKCCLPVNDGSDAALPPLFTQPTLEFLEKKGIRTAEELQLMDPKQLTKDLFNSEGYQLGCSLTAWCLGKVMENVVALELAGRCIKRWKMELGKRTDEKSSSEDQASTTPNAAEKVVTISIPDESSRSNSSDKPAHKDSTEQDKLGCAERKKKKDPETTPLSDLLSTSDCEILEEHFGVVTAADFLKMDKHKLLKEFQKLVSADKNRQNLRGTFGAGIVFAWCVRVREY